MQREKPQPLRRWHQKGAMAALGRKTFGETAWGIWESLGLNF